MSKTNFSIKQIKYLLDKQSDLDEAIRQEKGISIRAWRDDMEIEHEIALHVEIGEFINECRDVWKYWKEKPVDVELLLDEAVDVIHFCFLLLNNGDYGDSYSIQYEIEHELEDLHEFNRQESLHLLAGLDYPIATLALILKVIESYGFTTEDIMLAYDKKNKVNYERLESGTY